MLETLSLGGGIVYLKDVSGSGSFYDLGFCPNFELSANIEQEYKEEYFADASGNLVRVPSTVGAITSILTNGIFSCESMSRNMVQKIWFNGTSTDVGTELFGGSLIVPVVKALKFVSSSVTGPNYCVILPAVKLVTAGPVALISYDWRNVQFAFDVLYADNARTVPIIRVEEEGETLENFCT